MVLEKKSDVEYDTKYKKKGKVVEVVFDDPYKEEKEYKGGLVGGGVQGGVLGRKWHGGGGKRGDDGGDG